MNTNDLKAIFDKTAEEETTSEVVSSGPNVTEFVERYLQVANQLYLFHWQTRSYPQHMAFGSTNDALGDLVDTFVEAYQGKYSRVSIGTTRLLGNLESTEPVQFCKEYRDFLAGFKSTVESDGDLANIVDELVACMNKLLYLLTLN